MYTHYITCPISHEIMSDPVIAQDGNTYDRVNIEKWFKQKQTSPLTNEKINTSLIPNNSIKSMINNQIPVTNMLLNSMSNELSFLNDIVNKNDTPNMRTVCLHLLQVFTTNYK